MRFLGLNFTEAALMKNVATLLLSVITIFTAGCDKRHEPKADTAITQNQDLIIPDFVGFKVGSTAPSLKKCEMVDYGTYSSDGEAVCWWTAEQLTQSAGETVIPDGLYMLEFPQHRVPSGIRSSGSMIVIGGLVQRVSLRSNGLVSQANLLELLKDKYGEPDKFEWTTMTTKGGEAKQSFRSGWLYSDGYIWAEGITFSLDEGSVMASTPKADAWVKQGFGKNADSF